MPAAKNQRPSAPVKRPPRNRGLVKWGAVLLALVILGVAVRQYLSEARATADARPEGNGPDGMVWIPGGTFIMGDTEFLDAAPVHPVKLDGFWMDRTEVTNQQFARFVAETNYVTVAERDPDPKDFPGVSPEQLKAGSIVFTPPMPGENVDLTNPGLWWKYVPGASWKQPTGVGSTIDGRDLDPVVHIAWEDAAAYAKWAGKRLPTEAEWECAARGGLRSKPYVWGDEQKIEGAWRANVWQGEFPVENTTEDGYLRVAPVASYKPNGYGLYDMAGNVWEWCADWYRPDYYSKTPDKNPQGPNDSYDPNEPDAKKRVQRGGSFLCSDSYCVRYRPGGRGKGEINSSASHIGFRCVRSK